MSILFDKVHRLSKALTPFYCQLVNAEIVHPVSSVVVKPHELRSALSRPLHVARYEPERSAAFLAATLCYGLVQWHPFMDGNKRTAFLITNEYSKLLGLRGLQSTFPAKDIEQVVATWVSVAKGELPAEDLAPRIEQYFS